MGYEQCALCPNCSDRLGRCLLCAEALPNRGCFEPRRRPGFGAGEHHRPLAAMPDSPCESPEKGRASADVDNGWTALIPCSTPATSSRDEGCIRLRGHQFEVEDILTC